MFSKHQESPTDKTNGLNKEIIEMYTNTKSDVVKLLDKADENVDCFNYEVAEKFCQRALELETKNVRAIEMMASISVELGDVEKATNLYEQAIQLCPESGHSKYLSMGQFTDGTNSLAYYRKGIEILEKAIQENSQQPADSTTNCESEENLSRVLSNAYCAEVYMTDLCDDENADEMCSSSAQRAITSDETNPEAYQMMASYLLTKSEETNAREMMEKSLSFWFLHYQAVREGEAESDDAEICPLNFSGRIRAVKILLELGKYTESEIILNGLVEEDNEEVEVWYLLGWLNHLRGEMYSGNAKYYFHKCKKIANKVNFDDTQLLEHVDELLEQYGPEDDDEEEETDGGKENDGNDEECDIESTEEEMKES